MAKGFAGIHQGIAKARERAADNGLLPDIYWKDDRNKPNGDRHLQVIRFIPARNAEGEIDPDAVTDTREFYEFLVGNDGEQYHFAKPEGEGEDWIAANVKEMYRGKVKPPLAKWRTCALVALRQETRQVVDGQQIVSYVDKARNGTADGGRPLMGVVRQAYENFWAHFEKYADQFGSLTDRDYIVERWGNGRDDTVYRVTPCAPIEGLTTPEEVLAHYNPPVTLDDWMRNLESQERAISLLGSTADGRKAPEVQPGFQKAVPEQQMQTQGNPGYGMPPQPGYAPAAGYPQPGYGAPQGYPAPQPGYGAPQPGYGYPQPQGYGYPPQPGYGAPQGYPQPGYGAPQGYPGQPAPQGRPAQGAPQGPPPGYGQPAPQGPPPGYGQAPAQQPYGQPAPQPQAQPYGHPAPQQQPPQQPQQGYVAPQPPQHIPQVQGGFSQPPAPLTPSAPPQQHVSQEFESLRREITGGGPSASGEDESLRGKILGYQSDL